MGRLMMSCADAGAFAISQSLRRHDPDQVRWVGLCKTSQPEWAPQGDVREIAFLPAFGKE
jgi:hypothetical protein